VRALATALRRIQPHARTVPIEKLDPGGFATPLLPQSPAASAAGSTDPVLPLWVDWSRASGEAAALASQWAALEAGLARQVGFPRVAVPAPDGGAPAWVTTHADIDAALAARDDRSLGPQLHAELARRLALWRDAAARLGLDETDRLQDEAMSRSANLAESLIRVPAGGLTGAILKLELILRTGQAKTGDDEFPWVWLRVAIADLRRLAAGAGALGPDLSESVLRMSS